MIIYLVLLLLFYHPDSEARRLTGVFSTYILGYLKFLVHKGITCKSLSVLWIWNIYIYIYVPLL